jgi:DNA-binding phage protein
MPAADVDKLRDELQEIGRRRDDLSTDQAKLARDTRLALRRARGRLPVTEMARLVGLERSSLYRTYGDVLTT